MAIDIPTITNSLTKMRLQHFQSTRYQSKCSLSLCPRSKKRVGLTKNRFLHYNEPCYTLLLVYAWPHQRSISKTSVSDIWDSREAHYRLNIELLSRRVNLQHTKVNQRKILSLRILSRETHAAFLNSSSHSRWILLLGTNLTMISWRMIGFG